ncbi:hypothetical protein [Bradyrhizobium sp. Ai1a-2]|nr:hypothetical protein [Bradyrhizobium sp. Ai1a-2]
MPYLTGRTVNTTSSGMHGYNTCPPCLGLASDPNGIAMLYNDVHVNVAGM